MGRLHDGDNNDHDDNGNGSADDKTHLHVLPPHVLSHSVGSTTEALGGDGKVIGLILQRIQSFSTLGHLSDVFSHDPDCVINLLLDRSRFLVPLAGTSSSASAVAGNVGVVRLGHYADVKALIASSEEGREIKCEGMEADRKSVV